MKRIEWENYQDGDSTPLNAENLNLMQDNIEEAIDNIDISSELEDIETQLGGKVDKVDFINVNQEDNSLTVAGNVYANNVGVDTGWIIPTLTSDFKPFQDNPANTPKYRKIGKLVEIKGVVSPTKTITGSTTRHEIFTLPEEFRPTGMHNTYVMQGSGVNIWKLLISLDGTVYFTRYRAGDTYSDATSSTWLPFNVTYFVD